jgi:hypothetical protein
MEREIERSARIRRELDRLTEAWRARQPLPQPAPKTHPARPVGAPMIRG